MRLLDRIGKWWLGGAIGRRVPELGEMFEIYEELRAESELEYSGYGGIKLLLLTDFMPWLRNTFAGKVKKVMVDDDFDRMAYSVRLVINEDESYIFFIPKESIQDRPWMATLMADVMDKLIELEEK